MLIKLSTLIALISAVYCACLMDSDGDVTFILAMCICFTAIAGAGTLTIINEED